MGNLDNAGGMLVQAAERAAEKLPALEAKHVWAMAVADTHSLLLRYVSEARCLPAWAPRWWLTAEAQRRTADKVVAFHPTLSAGWEMRAIVYGNSGNSQLYDCDTTMR